METTTTFAPNISITTNLTRVVNSTLASLTTTVISDHESSPTTISSVTNNTTTSTLAPSTSPSLTSSTLVTSSTPITTTTMLSTTSVITSAVTEKTNALHSTDGSFSSMAFLSLILFIVAVAVIGKIIYSNRRRRSDLIGGTARWRLAASQQSGAGPQQTAASYAPMGGARQTSERNGLDTPGPDRLDWERQFFDDSEATVPSRLQLDLSRT